MLSKIILFILIVLLVHLAFYHGTQRMALCNVGALVDLCFKFYKRQVNYFGMTFNYNYSKMATLPLLIKSTKPTKTHYPPMVYERVLAAVLFNQDF